MDAKLGSDQFNWINFLRPLRYWRDETGSTTPIYAELKKELDFDPEVR